MNSKRSNKKSRTNGNKLSAFPLTGEVRLSLALTHAPFQWNLSQANCEPIDVLDSLAGRVFLFFFCWSPICGAAVYILILLFFAVEMRKGNSECFSHVRRWRKTQMKRFNTILVSSLFDACRMQYYSQINLKHIEPSKRSGVGQHQMHRPFFVRSELERRQH